MDYQDIVCFMSPKDDFFIQTNDITMTKALNLLQGGWVALPF